MKSHLPAFQPKQPLLIFSAPHKIKSGRLSVHKLSHLTYVKTVKANKQSAAGLGAALLNSGSH